MKKIEHDFNLSYPGGEDLYYKCLECNEIIPSAPNIIGCKCGNIFIDVDYGRMIVRDNTQIELYRVEK